MWRESEGFGRKRFQKTTDHISRLSRNEQPEFREGASEWQAALPLSIILRLPARKSYIGT